MCKAKSAGRRPNWLIKTLINAPRWALIMAPPGVERTNAAGKARGGETRGKRIVSIVTHKLKLS